LIHTKVHSVWLSRLICYVHVKLIIINLSVITQILSYFSQIICIFSASLIGSHSTRVKIKISICIIYKLTYIVTLSCWISLYLMYNSRPISGQLPQAKINTPWRGSNLKPGCKMELCFTVYCHYSWDRRQCNFRMQLKVTNVLLLVKQAAKHSVKQNKK